MSDKKLHYVRRVPKFLQGYSHLLQANKKNYMGEEIGYDQVTREGFQDENDIVEDGGVIVRKEIDSIGVKKIISSIGHQYEKVTTVENDGEIPNEEELAEVPSVRDFFPEEGPEEKQDEEEYFKDGKIVFNRKRGQKRQKDEGEKEESVGESDLSGIGGKESEGRKNKSQSEKKKKKLLSFDEEF